MMLIMVRKEVTFIWCGSCY